MSDGPNEIDLDTGILSFDGRVVEAFGFNEGDVQRVHIEMVEGVELKEGRWSMVQIYGRSTAGLGASVKLDESRKPELEAWMQVVRDAAPNLKQGR